MLAADPSSDALYVAWYSHAEARNQSDDFSGDLDIFFLASPDGGATWGQRVVVNDDRDAETPANQYLPNIAVAPGGRVDVAWYDGRLSPTLPAQGDGGEEGLQDIFSASSGDQGATFSRNVRVNDRSMDRSVGVWSNNIDSNHNVGLASTDDAVYVAWQDSRNANPELQPEDVYLASLQRPEALATTREASAVPGWAWALVGADLGAGLAMAAAWLASRRRQG